MDEGELKEMIRMVIREELPGIVAAVLNRLEEEKRARDERYWAELTPEEYERRYGS